MEGFWSYNRFKQEVRDLKQIYDFTSHLYLHEHERIKEQIANLRANNANNIKRLSVPTRLGTITHSLNSLYTHTRKNYPNKLRHLILINAITNLEVFFTNLVREISSRDLTPFKAEEKIEYSKGYLLNFATIKVIEDDIITKDIRRLTSGGLDESVKYFIKRFGIDFKNLSIEFNKIEEIHQRRHLFVHRNGVCDSFYSNSYPELGFKPGDLIILTHDYIVSALDRILEFAGKITEKASDKYPENKRKIISEKGDKVHDIGEIKLLIEIETKAGFNLEDLVSSPVDNTSLTLKDFVLQTIIFEKRIQIYISAKSARIRKIMRIFKNENFLLLNTTEIDF